MNFVQYGVVKHVLNSERACKNSVRKLLLSSFIYNSKDCIYRINFTSLFCVGVNFLSHPMGRMWLRLFCIMSLPCFFMVTCQIFHSSITVR